MAANTGHCTAHFMDLESLKCSTISAPTISSRYSVHFSNQRSYHQLCSLSMNGCQGDPTLPVRTIETRTFSFVLTPALAMDRLNSAVSDLQSQPAPSDSGIIRLQVPIQQQIEAIDWLRAQQQNQQLHLCFFSGRRQRRITGYPNSSMDSFNGNGCDDNIKDPAESNVVSIAGLGSAVFFRHLRPFSFDHWRSIKRFLSKKCPLIRAYGAIRFDARANISSEWEAFGSFYFMIPQVEFNELEGSSVLASTVAWDNSLSWTYGKAITALQGTMRQVSSVIVNLRKEVPNTFILSNNHVPSKKSWDCGVNKALQMINKSNSPLIKVVLARSSIIRTSPDIDPLTWLAALQVVSIWFPTP